MASKPKKPKMKPITDFFKGAEDDQSKGVEDNQRADDNRQRYPDAGTGSRPEMSSEMDQDHHVPEPSGSTEHPSMQLHINPEEAYHPNPSLIPWKQTKSQKIYFQEKWYKQFPWIHYDAKLQKMLCFQCSRAKQLGLLNLAKCQDPAFVSAGFDNWKKPERFKSHEKSDTHQHAVFELAAVEKPSVNELLDESAKKQQQGARQCLIKLFTTLRFLLRQGQAFRGHNESNGNFQQLLKLRSEDCQLLSSYLKRKTSFTSPEAQSEMIDAFSHEIVRKIATEVKRNGPFAVMVDGTQDISGKEQESICFRHVDDDLTIHEDFVGLYNVSETTGQAIANMIFDVLTRLCLSVDDLRAQTYDGAANMSGKYSGCQTIIRD